jgi:hypothetical protein
MLKIKHNIRDLSQDFLEQTPSKTSTTSAGISFEQETLFQVAAYKNSNIMPVSFSLHNQHYGKIDNNLMSLVPLEERTILINTENDISVLDFVSDAYFAFFLELQSFKASNKFSPSSKMYNFEATGKKEDLEDLYSSFLEDQYSYFLDFVNAKKMSEKIVDLNSFISQFANFVDSRTPLTPYNKSSFLYSNRISRRVTGLVIDLDNGDPNDDRNKFENYINHEDFQCYQDLVASFGFVINKDLPWQIIADLESVKMKYYFHLRMLKLVNNGTIEKSPVPTDKTRFEECKDVLENFNLTNFIFGSNNIIKYYDLLNFKDLENLKNLIYKFYNSFVEYQPKVTTTELVTLFNKIELEQVTTNRKFISRQEIDRIENTILRLYVYIKAREANMEWSQNKFDIIVEQARNLKNALDTERAMEYVQREINSVKNAKTKQRNFYF